MKTIQWELPFKNMHYLNSMTSDIAMNPHVILITGIQDEEGNISKCNITIKESEHENMDNVILHLGAAMGAHSVVYTQQMLELQEQIEETKTAFFGAMKEMIENIQSDAQEEEEEGSEDLFEKAERVELDEQALENIPAEEKEEKEEEEEEIDVKQTVEEEIEETVIEEEVKSQPASPEVKDKEEEEEQATEEVTQIEKVKRPSYYVQLKVILKNFMK